jgi:endothelin-converting enzyme/putative endopeptidase
MRIGRTLTALAALFAVALTPGTSRKGIETADISRAADPCTDFYEFANGAWRAANPIPPSMDRWSRRWQAGEQNKDKLKEILDEAAAVKEAPKGSAISTARAWTRPGSTASASSPSRRSSPRSRR